jgi:mono/diheme cytochrome c family protein
MAVSSSLAIAFTTLLYSAPEPAQEAKVKEIFDEWCTTCHSGGGNPASDPSGVDLAVPLSSLVGVNSVATGKPLVVPGDPDASYLLLKMKGGEGMDGEVMPLGDDPLKPEQLQIVADWIAALPPPGDGGTGTGDGGTGTGDGGTGTGDGGTGTGGGGTVTSGGGAPAKGREPFNGTTQIALPTTTTLGKRTLQYRIDHRFGRIGTERGAFGLDAGVSMAMGLSYGIIDGLDVQLRRANSRKAWEAGVKYVPLRQEAGQALSVGAYVALGWMRDFDVANPWVGDFQILVSRLWFDRWSTMLALGYHLNTNHNARVLVDYGNGDGPVPVRDRRDTLTMGVASTVWVDKRKRWGIDLEYFLPIPDGGNPNAFFYRGGDADPQGSKIGSWSIGGSLRTAKHFFQVFLTNNREISTNLYAPGGQTGNPFGADVDSKNPFHKANFFLGFNLAREFAIKAPKQRKAKAAAGGGK